MLCFVELQNVNPEKWVLKRSKCNPGGKSATGGVQKTSHKLVPIIRLKLTRDEDAAFDYYFVPGFKTKLPIFDPGVKIINFTKAIWEPPRPQVCSENKFAASKIKLTLSND